MKRNTALHHLWRRAVISQRGRSHEYYLSHRDGLLRQYADHEARKRAKKKEWDDNYQRKHAEELRARRKAWKDANSDKVRAWVESHRAYLAEKERERRRKKRIAKQTVALPMEEPT